MKYIYEISDGEHVYVGQSSAAGDDFKRMLQHISIAYGNVHAPDNPGLISMIQHNNLMDLDIKIFTEPYYGYSPDIFTAFFSYLTPYKHRTTALNASTSNNTIETNTTQEVTELMRLDAAEILHIANAVRTNKKVYNAEMGGQYYGWCLLTQPDVLILPQKFTPAEAMRTLDYIDTQLSQLQPNIDRAFSQWLNDSKTENSWNNFAKTITLNAKKLSEKSWKEFLFEEVSKWFWDTKSQTGAWLDLKKYLQQEVPLAVNVKLGLRTPSQVQESLATVISDSVAWKIRQSAKNKTYKDLDDAIQDIFSQKTFASGKPYTLSYAQMLSLTKNNITISKWWIQDGTPNFTDQSPEVANGVKKIAYNTMWNIYHEVAIEDVYEFGRVVDSENQIAFSKPVHPSLSAKIHDGYRARGIRSPIVDNNWRAFYGPMISLIINNYKNGAWQSLMLEVNEEMKTIMYRINETVEDDQTTYYVGHSVKGDREQDWYTSTLSQIKIY